MRYRRISIALLASALILPLSVVTPALANSLLSGYGGPGQGSQAILGATLLKGPSKGGGSGGGSGGSGGGSSGASGSQSVSGSGSSAAPAYSEARSNGSDGSSSQDSAARAASKPARHAVPARPPLSAPRYTGVSRAATTSRPLGLSGIDLLYIVLALFLLVLTALLTRALTRGRTVGDAAAAQGVRPESRRLQ